jgi:hypothetical protein
VECGRRSRSPVGIVVADELYPHSRSLVIPHYPRIAGTLPENRPRAKSGPQQPPPGFCSCCGCVASARQSKKGRECAESMLAGRPHSRSERTELQRQTNQIRGRNACNDGMERGESSACKNSKLACVAADLSGFWFSECCGIWQPAESPSRDGPPEVGSAGRCRSEKSKRE